MPQTIKIKNPEQQGYVTDNDKDYFKLAYLVTKDSSLPNGHSAVGLVHYDKDTQQKRLVARVGLWRNSQIKMEDSVEPRVGRDFMIKEISMDPERWEEQMSEFFHRLNKDRDHPYTASHQALQALESMGVNNPPGTPDEKAEVERSYRLESGQLDGDHEYLQSIPGGIKYNRYIENCKDYCIEVLSDIGIENNQLQSLENWFVSIPSRSGQLPKIHLYPDDDGSMLIAHEMDQQQAELELNNFIQKREKDYSNLSKKLDKLNGTKTSYSAYLLSFFYGSEEGKLKAKIQDIKKELQTAAKLLDAIKHPEEPPEFNEDDMAKLKSDNWAAFYQECLESNLLSNVSDAESKYGAKPGSGQ
jgi:hypothetical protein